MNRFAVQMLNITTISESSRDQVRRSSPAQVSKAQNYYLSLSVTVSTMERRSSNSVKVINILHNTKKR